jgi:hypothetical protein
VPPLQSIINDVFAWKLSDGTYDWGYPNTVDMTIYNKNEITHILQQLPYTNPNTLESFWAATAGRVKNRYGLCYAHSKVVNLPLNRVQHVYGNRNMAFATPEELLEVCNCGFKIDTTDLLKINNNSPHMEYEPVFVKRKRVQEVEYILA